MCSRRTESGVAFAVVLAIATLFWMPAGVARSAETAPKTAPVLIVWAGTLLAVPGHAPSTAQSIVVRGGVIERITAGRLTAASIGSDPTRTQTLDLSGLYVLPGLFDLHVHLTTEPDPSGSLDEVTLTAADLALRAAANAEKTLDAGFTTVLDMGTGRRAHELAIYAVRDAVAAGRVQ
ncbi:MAG TPA: amidohydrolase family protein, partial [Steroidobacteraceae bacterium]|nr:amidohydrolase family protein [Steroidobacteraceae bacterium]